MEFLDYLILGAKADLPTIGGVHSWWKQVVAQAIAIIAGYLILKNLAKLSVGKVVGAIMFTSAGLFCVQNWPTVTGWVSAILKTM
ncbi:hypothetical protein BV454_00511 [Bacillus altitudinis]|uniref:hypothetical protein n=1 Tax=Bacillus TaxID=1386 RepID=UPI000D02966A|nr:MULTISPECIES: hypothetical protein [Bacillus]MCL4097193.1 hypothetical protein [Bacillus altitudinis]PRS32125.1 hypothetical protein C6X96_12790 [Bacillus pumilus]